MRSRTSLLLCFLSASCAATPDEVRNKLTGEFRGQPVDAMVVRFGPPSSSFQMRDGSTAYTWNIGQVSNVNVSKYGGTTESFACVIKVIAWSDGKIINVDTTDASNVGNESLCAKRLGLRRS